jgi:hypothetical protein
MIEIARNANQLFKEPMMDAEVAKIATSAWKLDAAGLNFFTRPRVTLDHDIVDALTATNSDAVALLAVLERHHGGNDKFILANEMANKMGWSLPRYRLARGCLETLDAIRCKHAADAAPTTRRSTAGAQGAGKVSDSHTNITYTPPPLPPALS